MKFVKEFREFAMRGNVIDMAIGIIIGIAFGKIISSLVNDLIMPPVGLLLGKVDFSSLSVTLRAGSDTAEAVSLRYGLFINTVVDFLVVAIIIFILIKQINRFKKKEEKAAEPATMVCPRCFTDIPDRATRCPNCTSDLLTGNHSG